MAYQQPMHNGPNGYPQVAPEYANLNSLGQNSGLPSSTNHVNGMGTPQSFQNSGHPIVPSQSTLGQQPMRGMVNGNSMPPTSYNGSMNLPPVANSIPPSVTPSVPVLNSLASQKSGVMTSTVQQSIQSLPTNMQQLNINKPISHANNMPPPISTQNMPMSTSMGMPPLNNNRPVVQSSVMGTTNGTHLPQSSFASHQPPSQTQNHPNMPMVNGNPQQDRPPLVNTSNSSVAGMRFPPQSSATAGPMPPMSYGQVAPNMPPPPMVAASNQSNQSQYQQPQGIYSNIQPMPPPPMNNNLNSGHQQTVYANVHQSQQSQPLKYQTGQSITPGQMIPLGGRPIQQQPQPYATPSVVQSGFNRLWGQESVDLLQNRHILPQTKVEPPAISLNNQFYEAVNCSPDIFRCTLNKIPESNSLLQKSRLPLGVLIHPFRDLSNLPVIQCSNIVRCRTCRTYINPFVYFVDTKKWKCNLCYRVNDLPDEFQYDPVSKCFGDVTRRPEVKASTIEYIAPSEYMLRPPQPAIYLFLFDVSIIAQQSGYLSTVCNTLSEHLDNLPGDARTQLGFIAYNSAVHFYSIAEGYNQPHEVTIVDIEDVFLPFPDNLLINLNEHRESIKELLSKLPHRFANSHDSNSALGAALQVAFKLMSASGGRVSVFQTCLPNIGPGALQSRENPNDRSAKDVQHLGPATDFYKRLALECSGQQIAVDLFLLNSQYSDLATLSGISRFSGGCMYHFPLFSTTRQQLVAQLSKCLSRYLTRKIGFEAVMRLRCTRGLSVHTFHGNFFVRSTDLLSLPNVNPDAGFGMQLTYEESLSDLKTVCMQAALLYTSSKGERRIRVHTLCLPVTTSLTDVMYSADVQCIIGLLSKMAVDRSLQTSVTDARDAFINATVDVMSAFRLVMNMPQGTSGQLMMPQNLSLMALYILALLKHTAFRVGTSTRLDDRLFAMCEMKTLPLDQLMRYLYPEFYLLDSLFVETGASSDDKRFKCEPIRVQLSAERLDSRSMFLMDCGIEMYLLVGTNVPQDILNDVFGVKSINEIPEFSLDLPTLQNARSERLLQFIDIVNEDKPFSTVQVIKDTSQYRHLLIQRLIDDRSESSLSYYEFLQHLRTQVK